VAVRLRATRRPVQRKWARYLSEDHDRIAQGLNDVVAHQLFAAGLDLHAALGLIGDHRGAGKIHHAIGEAPVAVLRCCTSLLTHQIPRS
jgi:hypothetical protein